MDDINDKLDAFINRELSGCVEKVERIQGGFVNFTYRLYLKDDLSSSFSLLNDSNEHNLISSIKNLKLKSLIIKIASPYLAGSGQTIPFSIKRQEMEENALKLFNHIDSENDNTKLEDRFYLIPINKIISTLTNTFSMLIGYIFGKNSEISKEKSNDLSSVLSRNKMIKISNVLLRDGENNILVIEDHGPLPHVIQWILSEKIQTSSIDLINDYAKKYGENIGNFLVDMQISSLSSIEKLELLFRNPELQASLSKLMVSSFEKMRQTHNLIDADEIASIFIRCFQYDTSRQPNDGQVFSHGDFNVPNFLIDDQNSTLAIIDWELARVRSPAHDPALFLARARIYSIFHPENKSFIYFINGFINSYRESSKKNNVSWYKNQREQYLFAWYLGVAYGVAMLRWSPTMKCCSIQNQICDHQRDIVKEATDYIRRCKDGPEKITYDYMSADPFFGKLF